MLPSDIRLFTWVDVEEVLYREQQKPAGDNNWPECLVWARAYWDSLTLGIRQGSQDEILSWLNAVFAPRFHQDAESLMITLESWDLKAPRSLPVWLEETDEKTQSRFRPSLARPSVLTSPAKYIHPEPLDTSAPPVVVFHSFKGGVGRTLTAIAVAQAIVQRDSDTKVLLIDGDLEAPGVSWLLQERFPDPPIAFSDFLALVHSDFDPAATNSIKLVSERLQTLQLGNIFILPAFRHVSQFTTLEIKPEHLVQGNADPYRLTTLLTRLGEQLGVQTVLVDLRAGLSELATGLLLDPRIYRVLVTTLSDQSLQGTHQLLSLLGELSPVTQETEPMPAIVITKVLRELINTPVLTNSIDHLRDTVVNLLNGGSFSEDEEVLVNAVLEHRSELVALPASWNDVEELLMQHKISQDMQPIVDWLPLSVSSRARSIVSEFQDAQKREQLRHTLEDFAHRLVYAETGDMENFLTITPLSNLATDFRNKTPLAIIIGAKGSGKTYTFIQLARRKTWQKFVQNAIAADSSGEIYLSPVLFSMNLGEPARKLVDQNRQATEAALGLSSEYTTSAIQDYLRNGLQKNLHLGQWRERWLDVLAWSCGFHFKEADVGQEFATYLKTRQMTITGIVDGLEDLFPDTDKNQEQQNALRALLQDVPEWLRQQPGQPLGVLVFVRQDMVINAVQQNPAQLMARYDPYALKWSDEEALRLVAWVAQQQGIPLATEEDLHTLDFEQLSDALVPLWGRKLGSERSKEARSAHWVIAALSAFNGQIQARDLVRFLDVAANNSLSDTYWEDRVLVPAAIRNAIGTCGTEKIEEIGQENPELKRIFGLLTKLPQEVKQNPFTQAQVELSDDDIRRLENNGVIFHEEGKYHMSMLFAGGLGFKSVGGRIRVLSLMRRLRK